MSGNNPSFYYLVDLCCLAIGCWAECENPEILKGLSCQKNLYPLGEKEEGSEIKNMPLEYKKTRSLRAPDLFVSTAKTTFLDLILLC